MNKTRFSFLKPANRNSKIHARLSMIKNIKVSGSWIPWSDQEQKNCQWFKKMFYDSKRISFDIINIDDLDNRYDPFPDQLFLATDQNPNMKIVADRIKFIIDNYISPAA